MASAASAGGKCRVAAGGGGNPVPKRVIGTGKGSRLLMQQAAPGGRYLVLNHAMRQRISEQDPVACSAYLLRGQAGGDQLAEFS